MGADGGRNIHVNFHTLALDGVYLPGPTDDAPPTFVQAPEPTPDQVRSLCEKVAVRARRLVQRRPLSGSPALIVDARSARA